MAYTSLSNPDAIHDSPIHGKPTRDAATLGARKAVPKSVRLDSYTRTFRCSLWAALDASSMAADIRMKSMFTLTLILSLAACGQIDCVHPIKHFGYYKWY